VETPQATMEDLKEKLGRLLPQVRGVPIVTFSALTGKGVEKLMPKIEEIHGIWNARIPTAKLNRCLSIVSSKPPPPASRGRPVTLRYATQVKSRPPTFAICSSRAHEVPTSYKRYLVNTLREEFDLRGVPIRLNMRKRDNPFAAKASKRKLG